MASSNRPDRKRKTRRWAAAVGRAPIHEGSAKRQAYSRPSLNLSALQLPPPPLSGPPPPRGEESASSTTAANYQRSLPPLGEVPAKPGKGEVARRNSIG